METVRAVDDLTRRRDAQLRRGVQTNCFLSTDQLRALAARGALLAEEIPGGLLLLIRREGHFQLYFYLAADPAPLPPLPSPTVVEIAFRARDTAVRGTADFLQTQGFTPVLRRVRLKRSADPIRKESPASTADPPRVEAIEAFLRENFSPLIGCLPDRVELSADLTQGRVLTRTDAHGLTALLRFSRVGSRGEIRHLAVRSDCRGRGLAGELLTEYWYAVGGAASTVWTGTENRPALRTYEKAGFILDGWESVVLII